MNDKLQKFGASDGETPEVGQWYWVNDKDRKGNPYRWFGCVTHIGSNYVRLTEPSDEHSDHQSSSRIHFDSFWDMCELEPNPDEVIDGNIRTHQQNILRLMGRVKEITARLAVAPSPELYSGDETQALAVRNASDGDMNSYQTALVRAKDEELPDLFKKIKSENKNLAGWMTAKVIPLEAQSSALSDVMGTINDRIFSVKLYAGLTEEVTRVLDGDPAPLDAQIHLMQRLCYMDEECLANYEAGGMDYKNIGDFDNWLGRPENFERLLPFPRCVVSFRVRRNRRDREIINISDFVRVMSEEKADQKTFLYIRNGQQLYRMSTDLNFGEHLFPDMNAAKVDGGGRLWAHRHSRKVITDNEYQGMKEEYERRFAEYKRKDAAYEASLKTPEAKAKAKAKGYREPDASCTDVPWPGHRPFSDHDDFQIFDRSNLYYDDILEKMGHELKKHNQIALILQGLLDRSPVLHPHPPWQIWTQEGFQTALVLVYDESRALVSGEKPDFEAFRKRLNRTLKVGCVTVGQEDAWERFEAAKESRRLDNDYRSRGDWHRPTRHRPWGNPGPGLVARVEKFSKKSWKCSYAWERERLRPTYEDDGPIRTTFSCSGHEVLNLDAYTPGDFKQFFEDPRTRQEYLKWAPLLLVAEDYYAGKHQAADIPAPKPKKPSSYGARKKYQERKRREAVMGKDVRLVRDLETQSGMVYEKGTLCRVFANDIGQGGINVHVLDNHGKTIPGKYVIGVSPYDVELAESQSSS